MLSDDELDALARSESDLVEFKENHANLDRIRQAICAYANDLPAHGRSGVVIIGMRDDGSCADLPITDELLRTLSGLRSDGKLLPFPVMNVSSRVVNGCSVAVIEVQPSDNPPVRVENRVWIRVGPRRALATLEEERRLTEKRRWGTLPFDQQPVPGATLDDLDLNRFQLEYLPAASAPEVLAENHREPAGQLQALRLARGSVPTATGILILGVDPQSWFPGAYVQFVRFDGGDLTDAIRDQAQLTGPLPDQIRRLEEKLEAHIEVHADLSGPRERVRPNYPIEALRELIRNSILHRNYESTNAPVRVYWFADRIEINGPGGPYGTVTRENFGDGVATDYRNPTIAEALSKLGFIQRFGVGIQRARAALQRNGNPGPEFDLSDPSRVLTTVRLQ